MIDVKDVYYIAGILEGEGSFTVNNGTPVISLGMTDKDIIIRMVKIMRIDCTIHCTREIGKKEFYSFKLRSTKAIEWMMTLYSLMGERRKARIKELLFIWRGKKHSTTTHCRHGHPFTIINKDFKYEMSGTKYCLHCLKIKSRYGTLKAGLEAINAASV